MERALTLKLHRSPRTIRGIPIQRRSALASQRSTRGPFLADIPTLESDSHDPSLHRRKSRRGSIAYATPAWGGRSWIMQQPFRRPWEREGRPAIPIADVIREDYQHRVMKQEDDHD